MSLPSLLVRAGLQGARLPISVAEQLTDRAGIDIRDLPPIIAYDSVEAHTKQLLGRLLSDGPLVAESELQLAALRHRQSAARLAARAEEVGAEAGSDLEARLERTEASRHRVHQRTEERKQEIRRQEQDEQQRAAKTARRRQQAAAQAAAGRERRLHDQERRAEAARIRSEEKALAKQSKAIESERIVAAIDEQLSRN